MRAGKRCSGKTLRVRHPAAKLEKPQLLDRVEQMANNPILLDARLAPALRAQLNLVGPADKNRRHIFRTLHPGSRITRQSIF
jgi:hypothetical protein